MEIRIRGPVFVPCGYSKYIRSLIKHLINNGVKVQLIPFERQRDKLSNGFDFSSLINNRASPKNLLHCCDPSMIQRARGRNILMTFFELDGVPKSWVSRINNEIQELWMPNHFVKDAFLSSGVKLQPYIMPCGVETDNMCPGETKYRLPFSDKFTFLSNFQWGPRKGYDILLDAYINEFSAEDDVCLIIKYHGQMPGDVSETIKREIKMRCHKSNPPRFYLWKEFIPDEDLVHMYRAVDCYVLPSRGEGWGLPYMEAMACGLPTIGTNWSANLTFMNKNNSYLINVEKLEHPNFGTWYKPPLHYAKPSVSHLKYIMRYVYEHPKEAKFRGNRAYRDMQSYDWNNIIKVYLKRIGELQ